MKRLLASLATIQDDGKPVYTAYGKYYTLIKGSVTPFTSGLSEQKYMLEGKIQTINPIQFYKESSYVESLDEQLVSLIISSRMKRVGRETPNEEDMKFIRTELKKRGM